MFLDLSTEGRAVVFSENAENVAGAVKLVRELVHEIKEVWVLVVVAVPSAYFHMSKECCDRREIMTSGGLALQRKRLVKCCPKRFSMTDQPCRRCQRSM